MGLTVKSDDKGVKVIRKDRETKNGGKFATYSLMVSSKDMDGNWVNGFIDCQFKKGVEIANKTKIQINNAFYVVNEYNGNKYTKIMILDYQVLEEGEQVTTQQPLGGAEEFMTIPMGIDDELPFV